MAVLFIVTAIYVFGEEELHKDIKKKFSKSNWKKKPTKLNFKKDIKK